MDKAVIIKIITFILAVVLFAFCCFAEDGIKLARLRSFGAVDIQSNLILGGYFIIYLGFLIAALLSHEIDKELNAFFAFFGFALHAGLGYLYVEIGTMDKRYRSDDQHWLLLGIVILCQSVMLFFDAWVAGGGDICVIKAWIDQLVRGQQSGH